MQLKYCCTFWGSENENPVKFINKVTFAGYHGLEINLPFDNTFIQGLLSAIAVEKSKNQDFIFILQHLAEPEGDNIDDYIKKVEKNILNLAAYSPTFINSHTGKDYFTFDENSKIIDTMLNLSAKIGIKIMHETHRGRFSFHAATLIKYLEKFPEIELVGDFSHFCTVSESLLENQEHIINKIIPHISHLHARVGFEQGPQVNDPEAPEWNQHLKIFMQWWNKVIEQKKENGWEQFTITPEYGPSPYMPVTPYNKMNLSDQWTNNINMMNKLKLGYEFKV
jgi:sugar phosphate isomerase/epimerase